MKNVSRILSIAPVQLLFDNWLFLLPYLLVYLCCWVARVPIFSAVDAFTVLHVIFFSLACYYIATVKRRLTAAELIFFTLLFVLFLLPGAYLEFPSDVWEHVRRIFVWQRGGIISDYTPDEKLKFTYLFGWSLFQWLPIELRRTGLTVYSAIWQLAVCAQLYRFMIRLAIPRAWAFLHVLAFVFLFGTNVFSYRYYALSSSPIAYALYLQSLILIIDALRGKVFLRLLLLVPIGLLLYFTHRQELLLFFLIAPVLITGMYLANAAEGIRRRFKIAAVALILGGLFVGPFVVKLCPALYQGLRPGQVSWAGSMKVWDPSFEFYFQTIGVHGLVGLSLSLLFFRRRPLVATLAFAPIAYLLFPPSAAVLSAIIRDGYLTYRVLYAIPLSVALVNGFEQLSSWVGEKWPAFASRTFGVSVATISTLLLAYVPSSPWCGRMFFQLSQPPVARTFARLDETAVWFAKNRDLKKLRNCFILTDGATRFVLGAELGLQNYGGESGRRARDLDGQNYHTGAAIEAERAYRPNFCGALIVDRSLLPPTPPSPIGQLSGHWRDEIGDLHWLENAEFEKAGHEIESAGWRRTSVPPFYNYYEPPSSDH